MNSLHRALGCLASGLLGAALLACGGEAEPSVPSTPESEPSEPPAAEAPAPAEEPIRAEDVVAGEGALGRIGIAELRDGQTLEVPGDGCTQSTVYVLEGALRGLPEGGVRRSLAPTTYHASGEARVVVALARHADHPFGRECPLQAPSPDEQRDQEPDEPFLNAGGKLRVTLLLDGDAAHLAGLAHLDADADLSVPPHVHESSAEILHIVGGDGTMVRGEERFPIRAGETYEIPAGVEHAYEAGTQPLEAYQVYAPAGPEQRFRRPPTPPAFERAAQSGAQSAERARPPTPMEMP